ncbi:MAG: hypothetical protein COV97_11440 [Zetaproteobacteria bacterium CG11_big_fil_rev_8_21_14_0_20_59_439]|nr:MAG: hypothetical protein COV97_11440 [Zetaproteobacteria bacterium CG11_big_fil_rev_8_21_14_0_20_59_439]
MNHKKGVYRFEWEHRRKNGECFPVEVTLARIDIDGVQQLYCIWRDISERKQVEDALKQSEERLKQAQIIGEVGVWDWNPVTGALVWTEETYNIFGYALGEVEPGFELFLKHVHPEDREPLTRAVEAALHEGSKYDIDCRFMRVDNSEGVANAQGKVSFDAAGKPVRMLGTFQDITARKQTENRLREALSLQMATLEATADGILVVGNKGQWTAYNRKFADMWRIPEDILESGDDQRALDFVLDQLLDPQGFIDKVMSLYARPEESSFDVLHFRDGRVFERYSMEQRIEDEIVGRVWSFRDVTERHRTEEELRMSKFVMENAPYNITFLDEHAKIHYMNKTGRETFGLTEEEVRGMYLSDIDPGASDEIWREHWQDLKQRKQVSLEREHRRKNGEVFPVEIIANYMQFGQQAFNAAFDRDVSDKKSLEAQLRESHKMEAIGTLVGGIAHDFNNMLAAIQGNVYLARMQLQGQPDVSDKIDNIEQLGNRAAEMVKQLLTFARKDRVSMMVFSLNSFLNEGYRLTRTLIPENIEHSNVICSEELKVYGDATQLQQVLMNLLNNAVDALAGGSQPSIRCSLDAYEADDTFRLRHPHLAGERFACLSVQDNGCGIEPDALGKIFEPFFTTKEVGKGTGLGLSMLYGAVQTHGGVVEVESKPGQGSTFRIYLPLCVVDDPVESGNPAEPAGGYGETILLVDDQEDLRTTSAQVLSVLGYRVLQAGTGREALQVFHEQQGGIDLILSDVVMPDMGGVELLQVIRGEGCKVPVILATGYDRQHVLDRSGLDEYCIVISKPFDFNELSRNIQTMLHVE